MILGKKFFITPSDSVAMIAANADAIPYFKSGLKVWYTPALTHNMHLQHQQCPVIKPHNHKQELCNCASSSLLWDANQQLICQLSIETYCFWHTYTTMSGGVVVSCMCCGACLLDLLLPACKTHIIEYDPAYTRFLSVSFCFDLR